MGIGTLSGLNVLTIGKVAPGAAVELKDGLIGRVLSVKGRRLTPRGMIPGSAEIRLDDGSVKHAASGDIASVLHEAPPPIETTSSPLSGVPRPAGV